MKVLITAALPYVNNDLHLGHLIGSLLPADAFARYMRIMNNEVLFICGSDEYGTPTEVAALKEKISPKELCDKYYKVHKQVITNFNISVDKFGRTTNDEHVKLTQEIFMNLYNNGYIIEKEVEQPIDIETGTALADRYVEGQCPHCGYENARGDQCDDCGKLLSPRELINPISKISGTKPRFETTNHLFLDLPKIEPKLKKWQEQRVGNWNHTAQSIMKSWQELQQRDITRDIKWGIPIPLQGYENKVLYVWFDAPIGYISITKKHTDDWKQWWFGNNVKYYQFMGKDNVPFHGVIFPAMLLGDGRDWKTVDVLHAMEYLNFEGKKFSKSRNIGIFGRQVDKYNYPIDYWRFYLFMITPENGDTNFKLQEFEERVNKELIDNVGNLIRRLAVMVNRFGKVGKEELEIDTSYIDKYHELMEQREYKKALQTVLEFSARTNAYFQDKKPWDLIKSDNEKCNKVFYNIGYALQRISTMLYPFVPNVSSQMLSQFGFSLGFEDVNSFEVHKVVFMLDKMETKSEKGIKLKIGKIIEIDKHPEADKLYIEKINLGDKTVTIVSGLVDHYSKDELLGKKVLVAENLKPAKLRGVKSEGMVMAADNGDVEVLEPEGEVGQQVILQHETNKDQITIDELFSHKWTVKNYQVYYDEKELVIGGKKIKTKKIKEGNVK